MQLESTMQNSLALKFSADIAAGTASAYMKLRDAGDAVIVSWGLADPAFTVSAHVLTLAGTTLTSNTAAASATIGDGIIGDKDDNVEASFGVSTGGTPDLTLSSLDIAAGESFDLTAFSISFPAGTQDAS